MGGMWRDGIIRVAAIVIMAPVGVTEAGEAEKSAMASQTLEFRVVAGQTREPIAGVNLDIRIDGRTRKDVTNAQGLCKIEYGPPRPQYLSVTASKEGLVPIRAAWQLTAPSVGLPPEYTLAMDPGTSIGGIVRDEEGQPIDGVTLRLLLPSARGDRGSLGRGNVTEQVAIFDYMVKTDAQGRWRCGVVPARIDEILFRLEHPDYISDEMYNKTPAPPLEQLRDMTAVMVMKKGITVAGRVADANDRPIAGATVSQGRDRFGTHYPSTGTDKEGRFEFKNARADRMVLTVQASGYSPDLRQLVVSEDVGPVEFRLEPGRTLCGRIVDKAGNPIAGAFITADTWRGCRSLDWRVDTDPNGRFRWKNAPADEILFDMGKQHYMSVRRYGMIASEQEYTITMQSELRIKGRVTDEATGQPIPRFTVRSGIDSGNNRAILWERQRSTTFADGAYDFTFGQPYPAHLLRVEADGYMPSVSRPFDDGEGEVAYDFTLKKGGALNGIVRLPDGQPAAEAEVMFCTAGQSLFISNGRAPRRRDYVSAQTGPDGRFSFPPETDRYSLVVLHDEGFAELTDQDPTRPLEVTLKPWARVEGKVLSGSKPGVNEGVRVVFDRPSQANAPRVNFDCSTVTDRDGHFVVDRVPPGEARVCRTVKMGANMTMFSHDVPIEAKAGETTSVTIGGTGRPVIGTVASPDTIKDKIDWENSQCYLSKVSSEKGNRTIAIKIEPDGAFRAEDVPAGEYTLRLHAFGRAAEARSLMGSQIGMLTTLVTVPEMPGGRSDEPLDIGTLELLGVGGSMAAPSLLGKPLPDLGKPSFPVPAEDPNGKALLVCFFDLQQRPSRSATSQLVKKADALKQKGIIVLAVQASRVDQAALKSWLKETNVPFPTGTIQTDEDKTRFTWGVKALPWLILTDKNRIVRAEGFAVSELDSQIARISEE